VIATGFRADAELLLEFLSRDALRSARSLETYQPVAVHLMSDNIDEPLAAVARGYYLLRIDEWREADAPLQWFENLNARYPWIPDTTAILSAVKIRRGLKNRAAERDVVNGLENCLRRGLPMYAEGLSLLQEVASLLLQARAASASSPAVRTIQRLAASSTWAGAALSFYGSEPGMPAPEKVTGVPALGEVKERVYCRGSFSYTSVMASREQPESPAIAHRTDLMHLADITTWGRARNLARSAMTAAAALTSAAELQSFVLNQPGF
jgi:hypothetical protein